MAVQGESFHDWGRITLVRASILREIEDQQTEPDIATRLHMSYNGVRSHVRDLKLMTGCADVRDLGRWWRENRPKWLEYCAHQAGPGPQSRAGT